MASVKRKAGTDERPSKKAKSSDIKKRSEAGEDRAKAKKDGVAARKPAVQSLLQDEERAFPRGGASVLTPLEERQIRAEAERDALLEHETGQDNSGDLFDGEASSAAAKKKAKKQRKSETKSPKEEKSGIKISGLGYKSLVVGSTVLGRVTAITNRDIALALPNNLTGYVPITAVSSVLNARIDRLLADDTDETDDQDVNLKALFSRGQWLRGVVTSTGTDATDAGGKSKRHIELSIDPSAVNQGLDVDNAVANTTVQASVKSVEDHGVIMDLGLGDGSVTGFVSKKELGTAYTLEELQDGQVVLALVTGKAGNGRVLNLSLNPARLAANDAEKSSGLDSAPTVDAFLPGTAVNVLVTESSTQGVVGKLMGMVDVTADVIHSGSFANADTISKRFKIGSKLKARIIWALPKDDGSRSIGVSFLDHTLALTPEPSKLPKNATAKLKLLAAELEQKLPSSATVDGAKVLHLVSDRGLFFNMPDGLATIDGTIRGFAHISQISDKRIDSLSSSSGPYQLDSTHKVRILSYDPVDNFYYVSLKPSTLDQAFLKLEDVAVGQMVNGVVDKLILGGTKGVVGILVKLSDTVSGLIPEMHLSDTHLQHPERKFREGFPIKARVLSVDTDKRHLRMTVKKSLVDADDEQTRWQTYQNLKPGMESKGTVINLLPTGAVLQFFGAVRAWLPVAEMADTYVKDPEKHFRLGQTVTVRISSVDADAQELRVSCRDHSALEPAQQQAWDSVRGGDIVSGVISGKTADSVTLDLKSGLKGTLRLGHLVDGSLAKAESSLKRLRLGQKMANLLILDKLERSRTVLLSDKPAMIEDAKENCLVTSFSDAVVGKKVHGFVRNITSDSVYVEFVNETVGVVAKSQTLPEASALPDFGLRKDQTLVAWVSHVDSVKERFFLTMREPTEAQSVKVAQDFPIAEELKNPVDESLHTTADLTLGRIVKARIASIKATQVNVRLADNVQGRIDVSEVFDTWADILNKAAPLQKFQANEVVTVKILGIHDARNHRFLPLSHRRSKAPVFELSAKSSRIDGNSDLFSLDSVTPGSSHLAFINNHGENCVWVTLSPNVRGRIALMDLSDDVGSLQDVEKHFRIGRALRVIVKNVDYAANRLDLTTRQDAQSGPRTLKDLISGMTLPARVTKVTERSIVVQLGDDLVGPVPLVEMSDDYDQADPTKYTKNDVVRVCVLDTDLPNKKLFLSLRPSRVLSSNLPVKDPLITDASQLKAGDIVRGFVKYVGDKGVIVSLSARVEARIWITDLSDSFVKDWKSLVEIDQLVKGRVLAVDASSKEIRMSIKKSHVDEAYQRPLKLDDLEINQIVTGKVRKVEDFGAFIDIDNTLPRLSGLCHRSEVADKPVQDVRKLYSAGDKVKAKILHVDIEKRKISLGLKAKYFQDEGLEDDSTGAVQTEVAYASEDDDDISMDGGVGVEDASDADEVEDAEDDLISDAMQVDEERLPKSTVGLQTTGFDWTGDGMDVQDDAPLTDTEVEEMSHKKRKRNKPEVKVDLTGDLDKYGPRNVSDFERQLLGQSNDSGLWIQYMAFELQLGEMQKARDVAERALRTIHIRETEEKANIWIAWMNLEVEYGDDERVEDVFKQACQVQDPLEMHEKLASILIDSGKHDKADAIFERIVANKTFRASPAVWLNYGSFLMDKMRAATRARALLPRALQSVPTPEHRALTAKFAALEFKSSHGDAERGRTIFQGLVSEWPKWHGGWDMWADLEHSRLTHAAQAEDKRDATEHVRSLYDRMAAQKMKKRRAKFVFKKWLEFEEQEGSDKQVQRVQALAKAFVEKMQASSADDEGEE